MHILTIASVSGIILWVWGIQATDFDSVSKVNGPWAVLRAVLIGYIY